MKALRAEATEHREKSEELNQVAGMLSLIRGRVFTHRPATVEVLNGSKTPESLPIIMAARKVRRREATYVEPWRQALAILDAEETESKSDD